MTEKVMPIMGILLILLGIGFAICCSPIVLRTEYSMHLSVETPDKIENAISNVVSDLEKRDFVTVNLEVKWCPVSNTYEIHASGIDRTKLGKYEP